MSVGKNLHALKIDNKKLILELLCARETRSRKELAEYTGLTQAAVSKLTGELIADGKIRASGRLEQPAHVGRKEVNLSLTLDERRFLGVYAEINAVTFTVGSLDGKAKYTRQIGFTDDIPALVSAARSFLRDNFVSKNTLNYIGICVTGALQEDGFGCWNAAAVQCAFEDAFGLPVAVENNVKAFVLAEKYYGSVRSKDRTLFFKWGPGIGSALFAGGSVLSGDAGNVAEIGHYIVDPCGEKCRCGRYGCLETVCSCDVVVRETGAENLDALLNSEDEKVKLLLDEKINTVAVALTNTSTIFSTRRIVFFGTMFRVPYIAEKLRRQMIRYNQRLSEEKIELSGLNGQISVVSPAAVCAQRFFFSEMEETE